MTTTDLIEAYYRAFNSKNFSQMISYLSEDVIHDTNQGGRSVGIQAFRDFMAEMDEFYDEHLEQIVIMTNQKGDRAAAEFVCNGTYKTTAPGLPPARQQKYKLPVGCFFEVKDGKIARVSNYYNMKDWLEQVR